MTFSPEQEKDFNSFGCVSRCLMRLFQIKGGIVSKEDFCEKFGGLFVQNYFGGLLTSEIRDVIRALGLAHCFQVYRRFEEIEDSFNNEKKDILVSSEIRLELHKIDTIRHCSLLRCIHSDRFTIWTPINDGTEREITFPKKAWNDKEFYGIVLY
jgi:hypothetical protein